jgi:hypothetical protein
MVFKRLHFFPIIVFMLVFATVLISYTIAVLKDHVLPLFPYISDTGTLGPESCLFGQLLNMSAVVMALCVYLRHRQIVEFHRFAQERCRPVIRTSTAFLCFGLIAAFGVSLVANFQETRLIQVHLAGALAAFGVGIVYAWGQTGLTVLMKPVFCSKGLLICRVLLCIVQTVCFVSMHSCEYIERHLDANITNGHPKKVYPSEPGYSKYLCSTFSEWLMAFAFILYFLTFVHEFGRCHLVPPSLVLNVPIGALPSNDRPVVVPCPAEVVVSCPNDSTGGPPDALPKARSRSSKSEGSSVDDPGWNGDQERLIQSSVDIPASSAASPDFQAADTS